MKKQPKRIGVIKDEHTKEQMNALDEEWLNNKGPIMTLAETLAYAAEKAKNRATNAS